MSAHLIIPNLKYVLLLYFSAKGHERINMNVTENNTANITCDLERTLFSTNRVFAIIVSIYFMLLILGGVTMNMILIHMICSRRKFKTISNTFIVNLSVCDLITAIITLPFETDFLLRGHFDHGDIACALKETVVMFSLASSIINLLLLTTERFVKIVFPYKYNESFTSSKVIILLLVSWVYLIIIALIPLMGGSNATNTDNDFCYLDIPITYLIYQILVNFTIPLFCILAMNTIVIRIASKHTCTIEKQKNYLQDVEESVSVEDKRLFYTNYKTTKIIMKLVGFIIASWFIYILLVILNVSFRECFPRELIWLGNVINYTNVIGNPLLYGFLNKGIRKAILRKYLGRLFQNTDKERSWYLSHETVSAVAFYQEPRALTNNDDNNNAYTSANAKANANDNTNASTSTSTNISINTNTNTNINNNNNNNTNANSNNNTNSNNN